MGEDHSDDNEDYIAAMLMHEGVATVEDILQYEEIYVRTTTYQWVLSY